MLMYHGLADVLIMPQGSVRYYDRVVREMGSLKDGATVLSLLPDPRHGPRVEQRHDQSQRQPAAARQRCQRERHANQLYDVLTHWVENGAAPSRIDIASPVTATFPVAKSRPICLFPMKAKHIGGDINAAASYICAD